MTTTQATIDALKTLLALHGDDDLLPLAIEADGAGWLTPAMVEEARSRVIRWRKCFARLAPKPRSVMAMILDC